MVIFLCGTHHFRIKNYLALINFRIFNADFTRPHENQPNQAPANHKLLIP